jgi:hypothetical protein
MTESEGVAAFIAARTAAKANANVATPNPAPSAAPTVEATSHEAGQSGEQAETDPASEEIDNTADEATGDSTTEEVKPAEHTLAPDTVLFNTDDGTPVTLAEAQKSHYRQADYTRDKQSLNEIRSTVQQRGQLTDQAAAFLADALPNVIAVLESRVPAEPDATLRQTDVVKYWDQYNARQAALVEIDRAKQTQQAATFAQREIDQAREQERFQLEQDLLLKAVPAWRDQKVRTRDLSKITKYAAEVGYKPEEMKVTDHRLVRVLNDAVLGAEVRKGKANGQATPPKIAQPTINPQRVNSGVTRGTQADRGREQLKQIAMTGKDGQDKMAAAVALLGPRRPERARTR